MKNLDDTSVDYTKLVLKDMYEILTKDKNPWPKHYTRLKKLEFLDKMLNYLQNNQLYEMCDGVQKMKIKVINESVRKNKRTKRK